ncbi:hypothetical protein Sjap_011271 [Stephania japonica]|uniref:Uncharacterized protein n=1 Tax=Stephania japonica TaxID=461633 RepID=A0AAP0JB34_9MAGN
MPDSRESAGDALESQIGTGLLLVRFHCSLSSSSSLSPNLCYLTSNPTFLSFAPQCLPSRSSWLRREWRRFDFRICASLSSATVAKPGGIKVDNVVKAMSIVLVTVHIGEMTVKETLAFSARVQGVGAGHVGNYIPISQVRDDVATAYKKEMEWKTSKRLLPHKHLWSEKKVEAEIVQIEADDVPVAISNEVSRSKKGKLHQSKNIDTSLEGTRVLAKPSLPEAMNKCFLLIASYLVQTRFGAWGCFAFGEDTKDIITTNLEKLLVIYVAVMHAHLLVELHLQVRGIATLNPLMGSDLFLGSVRFTRFLKRIFCRLRHWQFAALAVFYCLHSCLSQNIKNRHLRSPIHCLHLEVHSLRHAREHIQETLYALLFPF